MPRQILIFGASYGSLLAIKLLLAGHTVKLVCLPVEAELINKEGARVRMPVKGREGLIEVDSRKLPGKLSASLPTEVKPAEDRKSTRLNSSHITISYAVFCLKKKKKEDEKAF